MNYLFLLLLAGALGIIQCLIGGTRLLFSFPAYLLIASAAVLSIFSIRRQASAVSLPAVFSTLALAVYVIIRSWFSPIAYLARPDAFMAAGCLMVYLLTALFLTESRFRLWLIGLLLVIATLEVGVAVVQFSRANGFMLFGFIRGDTSSRASGMFISGNHLAGFLNAAAIFALALTWWTRIPVWFKLVTAYLMVACYFGLAISGSRGGYLSAGFSLAVFVGLSIWVMRVARRGRYLVVLACSVLAFVLVVGVGGKVMLKSALFRERITRLGQATQDVRRYNWLAALDQSKINPLFGTGSGTHLIYGRLFRRPQIQSDPVHAHGDYLELLAEYGLVGGVLCVLFLGTHLLSGLNGAKQTAIRRLKGGFGPARSDTLALNLAALAATAALIAHSVVDFNMHIPGNALVYAFIFGILSNPGSDRPLASAAWVSSSTLFRLALFGTGIATLIGVIPKIKGEQLAEDARIALRNRHHGDCILLATKAIEEEPNNPDTWFYLGESNRSIASGMKVAALRGMLLEKAIEAYRRGLAIFPQDENLLIRTAQSLDGLGRYDEAEALYQDAIRWDPNLGVVYAYYGAHLRRVGMGDSAKKCFDAAHQLDTKGAAEVSSADVRSQLLLDLPVGDNANAEEIH